MNDKNFAYWHSATFNNDGTKVIFTDEWGGGTRPRCRATDLPNWGADAIFDIVDKKLQFKGYYKMPAAQTEQENCVAHNGSLIPVPGRDIMVQGWYQGGVSVFDFTDSAKPVEIAFFDRGPLDAKDLITGGYWSTYWYNGNIYASEIARGIDIFQLLPSEYLSQNEIDAAMLVRHEEFNAAAAAQGHLAGDGGGGQGVSRSAEPQQGHSGRARQGGRHGDGSCRTDALTARSRRERRGRSAHHPGDAAGGRRRVGVGPRPDAPEGTRRHAQDPGRAAPVGARPCSSRRRSSRGAGGAEISPRIPPVVRF